jgi:hypothetical protein
MRTIVDALVRDGIPRTRCFAGPHDNAPSLTRNNSAPKTVSEKTSTSMSPKTPSWRKTTAKGYMNTTLMSKITNHGDEVETDRKPLWWINF